MRIVTIMPTYNRPREFTRALASVAKQTRLPDELIVVGDRCEKIVWRQVEGAVKLFRKHTGGRVIVKAHNLARPGRDWGSTPKNYGIMHSLAPLVSYLDDDNWWTATHLAELEYALVNNRADLAWCGSFLHHPETGENVETRIPPEVPAFTKIDTSEMLHTRSILKKLDCPYGMWWRSHMYATDWDLVDRLMGVGARCVSIKKALSHYTLGGSPVGAARNPGTKHMPNRP